MTTKSRKKKTEKKERKTVKSFGNHTKDIFSARTENKGVIYDENKPHSHKEVVRQEKGFSVALRMKLRKLKFIF